MLFNIIFASMMALVTSGQYTPSTPTDTYLFGLTKLFPGFNPLNFFDGPKKNSNAPTTPTMSMKPTLEQMMYYNYYAASAYCPYDLTNLSCHYCQKFKKDVNEHKVLKNNDVNTLALITVSESRKEIVVAYRGSYNYANFLLDAIFFNGPNPDGPNSIKIHRGFYMAVMSLYVDVVKSVVYQRSLHPDYRIVITGHSLGAAMARVTQYMVMSLNQFPGAKLEVYTYGEPRVGNKYFADFINVQNVTTARIVARADIVSHYPPTSILGTKLAGDYYIHPQTEFWINGKGEQRFCDQSVYEDSTCSNSIGPLYTIFDHITYYFDVNYAICFSRNPQVVLAIPVIFEPVGKIPPLPTFISDFAEGAAYFISNPISSFFGR